MHGWQMWRPAPTLNAVPSWRPPASLCLFRSVAATELTSQAPWFSRLWFLRQKISIDWPLGAFLGHRAAEQPGAYRPQCFACDWFLLERPVYSHQTFISDSDDDEKCGKLHTVNPNAIKASQRLKRSLTQQEDALRTYFVSLSAWRHFTLCNRFKKS